MLKPCRECAGEVSSKAKTCPHCGIKDPVNSITFKEVVQAIFGLIVIVFFVSLFFGGSEEDEVEVAVTAPESAGPAPVPKPENTIGSRTYTVAEEKNHSFGSIRSRVTLEIESENATTEQAQIETMMKAAVERHRQNWPDAVSVRYWKSYKDDQIITNSLDYAVDGCGWAGDPCTGEIWSDVFQGEIPAHLMAWGTPTDAELEASKDLRCRQDLQCWGGEHQMLATFACQPLVEAAAQYSYEWTDGFLGSKFGRWRWEDRAAGTLAYTGNSVKFQNGFGAWQNMTYWCEYDPATDSAELTVIS